MDGTPSKRNDRHDGTPFSDTSTMQSPSSPPPRWVTGKRLVYLLGSVILAVALVGSPFLRPVEESPTTLRGDQRQKKKRTEGNMTMKGRWKKKKKKNHVDAPVVKQMPTSFRLDDDDFFATTTAKTLSSRIPIVHADDDTLPTNAEALDAYTNSLPASDSLVCRASVIAFVINATDVRDECDGLRKAFDKTCSVNSNAGSRRRLQSKGWYRGILSRWNVRVSNTTHHPRRLNQKPIDPNLTTERSSSKDEASSVLVPKKEDDSPKISLLIPTADEHISEDLLNDALLLQEANDEPKEDAAHPAANNTANLEEAARDAAESANSIRTATDAVKQMMMDPKSVEARTCCASILSVFHEHCDPTTTGIDDYSDRKLLVVVFVVTVCGIIKSVIRYFHIRWLPEAGGCILVGVMGYLILQNVSHVQYAFDGDLFLRIMVPPIVFEAAVKINKRSFQRHVVPITIFAIVGTLASTALTATILYNGSSMIRWCPTIPVKESLIFGALISSIDPIAVLSVLNNMGMTDSDTIYVLIFGESLLNDGIAIVLFQTLVHFLDESLVINGEVVVDAIIHFVVVALGSLTVGIASGSCATVYFAMMHGMQTPMVELISFLAWAFVPYFICDMVEWSGIVAIVANGFMMDLYIVGQRNHLSGSSVDDEINFEVNATSDGNNPHGGNTDNNNNRGRSNAQIYRSFFSNEGHLSPLANSHVHFVIEIFATLMETAIFAYLGLFLFSSRYHWNKYLTIISIFATVMGRVIMIPILSHVSNIVNRMVISRSNRPSCIPRNDNNENAHVDRRMQTVLIFAGLRGAMSFALVEYIPMFDTITGQGTYLKPELKAMTSASIIFTVFILGGATSYLMERVGYSVNSKLQQDHTEIEVAPLVRESKPRSNGISSRHQITSSTSVRQRGGGIR